jgi:hypothetical protein
MALYLKKSLEDSLIFNAARLHLACDHIFALLFIKMVIISRMRRLGYKKATEEDKTDEAQHG